jgi:hypothetical protein
LPASSWPYRFRETYISGAGQSEIAMADSDEDGQPDQLPVEMYGLDFE